MDLTWEDWIQPADPGRSKTSPYADWWNEIDRVSGARHVSAFSRLTLKSASTGPTGLRLVLTSGQTESVGTGAAPDDLDEDADAAIEDAFGASGALVPLPEHARCDCTPAADVVPVLARPLARDAVIVGVIDTSIAICHDRFRFADGKSRVLAAWQMTAPCPAADYGTAGRVAYGREVWQGEIDRAIAAAAGDEAAASRALGLTDYENPAGTREIDLNADHGTQVTDLAAGFDATDPEQAALAGRMPILAVNLPSNRVLGGSGAFLEYFVMHAIEWMIDRADAIWNARFPDEAGRGFPMVLNLSYGLAAGPKDGTMLLEKYVARLLAERASPDNLPPRAPVRITLPAGNDNLERGHAVAHLSAKQRSVDLTWRLPPEDDASSHVEIWLPTQATAAVAYTLPVRVELIAPGATVGAAVAAPAPGMTRDLRDDLGRPVARIYVRQAHDGPLGDAGGSNSRQMYTLCIAPTHCRRPGLAVAPCGAWTIRLWQDDDTPREVHLYIQSERALNPSGQPQHRSYFDDPAYQMYDWMGALVDTYDAAGLDQEFWRDPLRVRRKGTINAIATVPGALVVGSHRASDQLPAPWSASGHETGPAMPSLSFASEDSISHPGVLTAGNRSGSVVTMSGTSFASALATRRIAQELLTWSGDPESWTNQALITEAANGPGAATAGAFQRKIGAGRLPSPPTGRVPRRMFP